MRACLSDSALPFWRKCSLLIGCLYICCRSLVYDLLNIYKTFTNPFSGVHMIDKAFFSGTLHILFGARGSLSRNRLTVSVISCTQQDWILIQRRFSLLFLTIISNLLFSWKKKRENKSLHILEENFCTYLIGGWNIFYSWIM